MVFQQPTRRPSLQRVLPLERRDSTSRPTRPQHNPNHQYHTQHQQPSSLPPTPSSSTAAMADSYATITTTATVGVGAPQRQPLVSDPARAVAASTTRGGAAAGARSPSNDSRHDPRTWVLFEPASDANTSSYLSDGASLATPGRSRFSQPGSEVPRAPSEVAWGVYDGYSYDEDDADEDVIIDDETEEPEGEDEEANEEEEEDRSLAVDEDDNDTDDDDDDDAELDSLDSHLPEFRVGTPIYPSAQNHNYTYNHRYFGNQSTPNLASTSAQQQQMMPAHDGLGSFRIYQPGTSVDVQEQIYAHERYNRRLRRRRESQELAERQESEALAQEAAKMQRIEAWRLEQSRILLDEIQKLTSIRREQQQEMSQRSQRSGVARSVSQASLRRVPSLRASTTSTTARSRYEQERARASQRENVDWHDEDSMMHHLAHESPYVATSTSDNAPEPGFWTNITKRVIRDIMGIDDRLLAILFGEHLPDDEDLLAASNHSRAASAGMAAAEDATESSRWHLHVLERVARELGMLVNKLSHHHPGAFSTYVRVQQAPLPYAGLPVIPEAAGGVVTDPRRDVLPSLPPSPATTTHSPQFHPSRPPPRAHYHQHQHHSRRDQHASPTPYSHTNASTASLPSPSTNTVFTQEEWEQDLDIKLVFRYLRSRFSTRSLSSFYSSASASSPTAAASSAQARHAPAQHAAAPYMSTATNGTSHLATASTSDAAAKSARVRQHHPLIGRQSHGRVCKPSSSNHPAASTTAPVGGVGSVGVSSSAAGSIPIPAAARRTAPSCKSQSTRRSAAVAAAARRSSVSSRHYWDLGGSVASGSAIASTGPMGSWGEV